MNKALLLLLIFFVEEYAENYPFQYRDQLPKEPVAYLEKKE